MTPSAFRLARAGRSRSFPDGDPFPALAAEAAAILVVIGEDAAGYAAQIAERPDLLLVELGLACLGELTGERQGEEGGPVLGFSRYRLGSGPPSQLIELVVQPQTPESAKAAAIALFEGAGFSVAVCADRPGRIVDRLVRPYFNSVLERLDDGLATAEGLDQALKLGLGFGHGPVAWLAETGLDDHARVSDALAAVLHDPYFRPARRAQVAARKKTDP